MAHRLAVFGALWTALAQAAAPERVPEPTPGPIDAFLASSVERPLVDPGELSPEGRAALASGRVSSVEPRFGVPSFFWAGGGAPRPAERGLGPEQAARQHLRAYAELYRADPDRWAQATVRSVHDLKDGSAVLVSLHQRVRGVSVFRDEVTVVMTPRFELLAISGYLTPQLRELGPGALQAESAVASAFHSLTGRGLESWRLTPLPEENGYRRFALADEPTPVRLRQVYFAMPRGLVPGFHIELELSRETDTLAYAFVISAIDGTVLLRQNLTVSDVFTYRVWADDRPPHAPFDSPLGNAPTPHPTGTPNGYQPPSVPPSLVSLQNGPIGTNDPWLAPGTTTTRGNNVIAYVDRTPPNGYNLGDLYASTTGPNTFDRVFVVSQAPNASDAQRQAAVTQLFYDVNFFHDWYYDSGFQEAAGNAQESNFGRGGADRDPLLAEAQDYSGRNNANMSTPSDGASPRMQMYIFDGPPVSELRLETAPARNMSTGVATFGPQTFTTRAPIALVNDGNTTGGSTSSDACSTPFVSSVAGQIALVDRGQCAFTVKAQNALASGAVGLIIADNVAGTSPPILSGTGTVNLATVSVTQQDGATLRSLVAQGVLTGTMSRSASVDRDGTIDNVVVAHEWGHYISNRLIGNGNGLSNLQGVGMGEGWGDMHALLLVVKEADAQGSANANFAGVYGLPGYAGAGFDPNSHYFGFRRLPYSTDLTKNGLTFRHIQDGVALPAGMPIAPAPARQPNSEVHNTGEVWATMLWECYAALLRDGSRLTFAQAQQRMRNYLVAGDKATPVMPTFVEARDALLAVALANDPADFAAFWRAFAKRGLGMQAVAPPRNAAGNQPLVESFAVGNAVQVASSALDDGVQSCDRDGVLDAGEVGFFTLTLKNIGVGTLSRTTAQVSTSSPGLSFPQGTVLSFPSMVAFATASARVQVAASTLTNSQAVTLHVTVTDPELSGPVSADAPFRVNFDVLPASAALDDVEFTTTSWTVDHDSALNTGSDWRRFEESGTAHWWFGPNAASPADTWLSSPPLQVGTDRLVMTFRHRWDFESDATTHYDGAVLELSTDNGVTWTDIGQSASPPYPGVLSAQGRNPLRGRSAFVGRSPGFPAFVAQTVDLGTTYASRTVKIRFRAGADDAAAAKGWEVDDIRFEGLTNRPFPSAGPNATPCQANRPPVATAPAQVTVNEGEVVVIQGAASDPDGDALTLSWAQTSGPLVALNGQATDRLSYTAPLVDSDTAMGFTFTATDAQASTRTSVEVLVRNSPGTNRPPLATAPAQVTASEGEAVLIRGTASDPDGDPLSLSWVQTSGPSVVLNGQATDQLSYTAPQVDSDTVMTFTFTASDARVSTRAPVEVLVRDSPPKKGCGCNASSQELAAALLLMLVLMSRVGSSPLAFRKGLG